MLTNNMANLIKNTQICHINQNMCILLKTQNQTDQQDLVNGMKITPTGETEEKHASKFFDVMNRTKIPWMTQISN